MQKLEKLESELEAKKAEFDSLRSKNDMKRMLREEENQEMMQMLGELIKQNEELILEERRLTNEQKELEKAYDKIEGDESLKMRNKIFKSFEPKISKRKSRVSVSKEKNNSEDDPKISIEGERNIELISIEKLKESLRLYGTKNLDKILNSELSR